MSKFCGNCGTQMNDDAKVCGNCGMPYKAISAGSSLSKIKIPGVSSVTPEQKNQVQKIAKIAILVIAVILVVSIIGNVIVSFTGYKGAIRKMMNAYEECDGEAMAAISSDFLVTLVEDDYEDPVEGITNLLLDTMDELEQEVGPDIKLSYDISDCKKFSDTYIKKAVAEWEKGFDYQGDDIEKAVKASLKVEIKGADDTKTKRLSVFLVKEPDGWKIATSDWLEEANY